ncbi:MAG: hypothetical protein CSA33_07805 [Desulfobulbus propionicus]|nr:MAG: hypothetical protein CSA33_07805 [Desulfobulbus propionicus]
MKRLTTVVEFNGKDFPLKELSALEIERVMSDLEKGHYQGHVLDALMADRKLPACVVFLSMGTDGKHFDLNVAPSELENLYDKVAEVNPRCAAMMERLVETGVRLQQSGKPPASSS